MDKRFWVIIGIIIAIFAGILLINHKQGTTGTTTSKSVQPTNHIEGNTTSKVKLVEYGDFQCPYCGEYYPLVQQVESQYKDKIAFQFRNLPLSQVHQNAFAAARAAEAADNQGKFWDMYNLLYQNQSNWVNSNDVETIFIGYASQLGLNTTQFKQDFASNAVNDRINADINEFNRTGLPMATPTFLLNGKQIQPTSVNEFSKDIDAALNSNK